MLCIHLYQRLPQYLPKATVQFTGGLHATISRQVSLSLLNFCTGHLVKCFFNTNEYTFTGNNDNYSLFLSGLLFKERICSLWEQILSLKSSRIFERFQTLLWLKGDPSDTDVFNCLLKGGYSKRKTLHKVRIHKPGMGSKFSFAGVSRTSFSKARQKPD